MDKFFHSICYKLKAFHAKQITPEGADMLRYHFADSGMRAAFKHF
jgi:hypothetical protein